MPGEMHPLKQFLNNELRVENGKASAFAELLLDG